MQGPQTSSALARGPVINALGGKKGPEPTGRKARDRCKSSWRHKGRSARITSQMSADRTGVEEGPETDKDPPYAHANIHQRWVRRNVREVVPGTDGFKKLIRPQVGKKVSASGSGVPYRILQGGGIHAIEK